MDSADKKEEMQRQGYDYLGTYSPNKIKEAVNFAVSLGYMLTEKEEYERGFILWGKRSLYSPIETLEEVAA